MTTKTNGQLEIDHARGVIYFTSRKTGQTLLRICRVGTIPTKVEFIDLTHMSGVSFTPSEKVLTMRSKAPRVVPFNERYTHTGVYLVHALPGMLNDEHYAVYQDGKYSGQVFYTLAKANAYLKGLKSETQRVGE